MNAVSRYARPAVCVTGMHRSGTSVATHAIQLLGVSLGDEGLLLPPGHDNPRGYYENQLAKELDDELLAHLGGSWDRPPVLDPGWEHDTSLEPLRGRAREVLATSFRDIPEHVLVGWKDPRLSLLLPFWRTVIDVRTSIVVVRDPTEVAASLAERNGFPPWHSALLWLRYLLAATTADPGYLLVTLPELFEQPRSSLGRIAVHLGLSPPDDGVIATFTASLDPTLRHHDGRTAPRPDDPVSALADRVWNDGDVALGSLAPEVGTAIAAGWLRSPADDAALTAARAESTELKERLRKRGRKVRQLQAQLEAATTTVQTTPAPGR